MDGRKITPQLLVDVACTVDYFNESSDIVPLTKDYIQIDHVLLIENGLSPPKLFVKIPRSTSVSSSPAHSLQGKKIIASKLKPPPPEWLSEYMDFNDSNDDIESKSLDHKRLLESPAVITKRMEDDITEIKNLLHSEIKENRQHKKDYIDLHTSVQKKMYEIAKKISFFEISEIKEVEEVIADECPEDSSYGIDAFAIDKSSFVSNDGSQKLSNDDHQFDLNSVSEYFPLTTNIEILAFENKVRRDYSFKEKMIKTLYQVGGENARVACRKLAKIIFTDEILIEYSYEGIQSKKKFKEFKEIIEIIFLAVYNRFNDYTMEQHKSGLSDHLRYANSRIKKRKNAILSKQDHTPKKTKYDELEMESIEYSQ